MFKLFNKITNKLLMWNWVNYKVKWLSICNKYRRIRSRLFPLFNNKMLKIMMIIRNKSLKLVDSKMFYKNRLKAS